MKYYTTYTKAYPTRPDFADVFLGQHIGTTF